MAIQATAALSAGAGFSVPARKSEARPAPAATAPDRAAQLRARMSASGFAPSAAPSSLETLARNAPPVLRQQVTDGAGETLSNVRDYLHESSADFRATEQKRDELGSAYSSLSRVDHQLSLDRKTKNDPRARQALAKRYNDTIDSLMARGSQLVTAADKLPDLQGYASMVGQTRAKLDDISKRQSAQQTALNNSIYGLHRLLTQ